MLIGKAGAATTSISTADAASVTVRGRDLCGDLMGRLSFTDYFHLLVTGREPTEEQRFFLDLLLVAIAEHGLVPTNQVARMTYAADPGGAAGRGGGGHPRLRLGGARDAPRPAGGFLDRGAGAHRRRAALREVVARSGRRAARCRGSGIRCTSRSTRGRSGSWRWPRQRGVAGAHVALAREAEAVVPEVWGKPLPMNVSMPIAAVLLDLDFPPAILKGDPDPRAHRVAAGASRGGERATRSAS